MAVPHVTHHTSDTDTASHTPQALSQLRRGHGGEARARESERERARERERKETSVEAHVNQQSLLLPPAPRPVSQRRYVTT
eukprot:3832169-Rhodomonas_salina.1